VVDLLTALNTGHEGGCGTIHANSASDVPARLEALGALAGLSRDAVHSQVASALHAVIHLTRASDGVRRIAEIRTIDRQPDGHVVTRPAVEFLPTGAINVLPPAHHFTTLLPGAA
jgi:pilus assembly protein CpaF